MSFLILYIETVPRPSIDDVVDVEITKKTKARVERTGDDLENAESDLHPHFLVRFYV